MELKNYRVLLKINSPDDLKKLKLKELKRLAEELRDYIIRVVSKNGGHLAPNLGVVELTIALHRVFNSPEDKIIWDVGHQCYAHKIITGRKHLFPTIRKFKGLSGFPKREESPHDVLNTGHSSTSISAGLGMSTALRLKGERDKKVVVVIGDGSITAGLAFEGLNNAGYTKEDLIIVLNDNEMSISPNVGALSSFVSKRLTGNLARFLKKEFEKLAHKFPGGEGLLNFLKKSEELIKIAITPGALFTALNFEYIGPVDGHDLETLITLFQNIKPLKGPILLHLITKKGKGYPPAEKNPEKFHGIGPFDIKTGEPLKPEKAPPTYTEVFGKTIVKLAEMEPRLVAITAAMKTGTGLTEFAKRFPERFFDVGICEQHAVTFATGLALEGMIPVCAIYSTFLQRAYDQLIHDVALNKAKVIFAIDRAGLVGEDGPTHHGAFDLSYLKVIPGFVIMIPKDEEELKNMLYTALNIPYPVAIRYPRGYGEGVPISEDFKEIPFGRAEVLKEGEDVVIIGAGYPVHLAMKAAQILEKEKIYPIVVNLRFLKPIDRETVKRVAKKAKKVITIEDNSIVGGVGSEIAEILLEMGKPIKFKKIGIPDRFIEHGDLENLRKLCGLTVENIVKTVKDL